MFGKEDVLVNNIAWALRRLPVFGVFGDGQYKLQPIHVEDLADLAVRCGESRDNETIDAVGPETFTYRDLVTTIGELIGVRRRVVSVPPWLGYAVGKLLGWWVNDVVITPAEIEGLMANLLCTDSPPVGTTRLTEWIRTHAPELGLRYTSELARRRDRTSMYASN